ncbi:unnamed protein product [Clonostachys rosea f. rosea IK726]|uniref:Uncharacterized protein n=1 Tax=Clonostachys rosea f. rosea IK726 TaxID=1349383 RepID=A0ACA9TRN8_BIOOC|nr:unnamed protein product [Clonostachys rosea f. rosea IK726]
MCEACTSVSLALGIFGVCSLIVAVALPALSELGHLPIDVSMRQEIRYGQSVILAFSSMTFVVVS